MQTILWLSPKRCSFDEIASGIPTAFSRLNRNGSTIDSRPATSQLNHPNCTKDGIVAKPELGTKRLCAGCGAKFYDLNKDPIHCPKCGTPFEVVPVTTRPRPDQRAAVREPEPEAEEAQEAELIALEEADAE